MHFDLSSEQLAFQDSVATYLAKECPTKRVLQAYEAGPEGEIAFWKGLMDLGVGAIPVPEAYGGAGLELLDLASIAEVVGRYVMPGPFLEHALATLAIAQGGSEAQKRQWLPGLASGKLRGTVALCETGESWFPGAWTLAGDDTVTGEKSFVPHATGADLIVVGLAGGTLGVVEAGSGVEIDPLPTLDGSRRLDRIRLAGARLGRLDGDPSLATRLLDAGSVLLAADAYGGASQCVRMAAEYARTRVQFGQTIGHFQGLKHQLADMALEAEPTVGLYWYAAHCFDHDREQSSLQASLAKAHITDVYAQVSRKTVEAHGGIGYTWEYGVHLWLKRATFDRAFLGRPESHRARVADLSGW